MTYDSLAIDFGTRNTVAAVCSHSGSGQVLLERVKFGNDWRLPSAVFWSEDGPVVGVNAERSRRMDPTRFVRAPKREMGYDTLLVGGEQVPVCDVVAAVLSAARREVLQQLGSLPPKVVLTRPVQWAAERQTLFERSARDAGFTEAQFLEEPVAAAVRLANFGELPDGSPFAVVDFGAGTLDVSVVRRNATDFDFLATDGADPLGGEDIDDLIFNYVVGVLPDQQAAHQLATSPDLTWRRHRDAVRTNCRLAKEQLSEQERGAIGIPFTGEDVYLTREHFDVLVGPVLLRAAGVLQEAVREAGVEPSAVTVHLVGGSSRVPALATIIAAQLGGPVRALGDPQFVVSEGAALYAAQRSVGASPTGQIPFTARLRERYPGQWAMTEEASKRANEFLHAAQERALEAGGRAREAAGARAREAAGWARDAAERASAATRAKASSAQAPQSGYAGSGAGPRQPGPAPTGSSGSGRVIVVGVVVLILLLIVVIAST